MANTLTHRGPDSGGMWVDDIAGFALAHRRLAILDLSPAGSQPMTSTSGRYVVAFNGQIYNHDTLRHELAAEREVFWRSHADTETLLAAIDAWGLEETLKRSIGMFAIALWDREQSELLLARDRLGEKPLYYGWQGNGHQKCFLFGSELKALRAHSAFEGRISRDALALYLRHNYIPAPYSIYEGIQKLPPASILTVSRAHPNGHIRPYWSVIDRAIEGAQERREVNAPDAIDELEALLKNAIGQQMVADVPLGAFLSGGIDSSTVVALMQAQSSQPVQTFSIGFNEDQYNEATHAKAVASHLGTHHTELYVTPQQALNVVPLLPSIYDEPFADSSQVPTFLVSQLARKQVTVALSGDGGDELFGGYTRYFTALDWWRRLSRLPRSLRQGAAGVITRISPQTWDAVARKLPLRQFRDRFGDKMHKAASVLATPSIDALYLGLVSHWASPTEVVLDSTEPVTPLKSHTEKLNALSPAERMMTLDMISYLPDDILTKVDRAGMAVSLETRIPMLDHRVVEFACRLPIDLKLRDGSGKWLLRQVLYRHVPPALVDRPKMGFGVPIDSWLRGPLRDWAEELLEPGRLRNEGFFDPVPIRSKWSEHLSERRNWAYHLWDVLMFQAWLREHAQ